MSQNALFAKGDGASAARFQRNIKWKDWKEVLTREKTGRIYDEYGEEWSAQEFIAMVEASKEGKNHGEYCGFADGTWNDSDGWSFSLTEFC